MLRKVASNLLRTMSKMEKLRHLRKDIPQVQQMENSDKNIYALISSCRYQFSSGQSKDPKSNETQNSSQKKQDQNIQTIQVSLQEFRKMKELLQQLKSQISDLQSQQHKNNKKDSSQQSSVNKKSRQLDAKLSKKLQQFSNQSTAPKEVTQNLINQKDSPLFFKSLQQQLSLQLIKLNSKQQFTQLIQHYIKKFDQTQQNNGSCKNQCQKFNQLVRLSYLIFYRYTSLQNAKIDDLPIKNLLLKIVSHTDILQQTQVQKLLSILNDQIKDKESKWQQQHQNSIYKINAVFHQNFRTFVKDIKKNLLVDNKVFNFKSQTNKNSEILSLIFHFFDAKELSSSSFQPMLQKEINDQQSQKKLMIYNPTNQSHLLVNMLQSGTKNNKKVLDFYELFQLSLSITQSNFTNQEIGAQKLQIEESLKMKNAKEFQRYQYQGIIYFLQNYPQTNQNLFSRFFNLLISENRQIQKFQLIHQLRMCLGFLTRPQILKLNHSFDSKVVLEIYRILNNTKDSLFQAPTQNGQVFEADENVQFLHLKKVAMILSQIGIQLFKSYRTIVKDKQNVQIQNNLKEIILSILKSLNQVCNEKVDLKDLFKNEQKQNVSQKLILNLNLFQFIVNLNILTKWFVSLTQEQNNEGLSSQLLTNLVSIFINQTKRTLINQHISQQRKLKIAEQLVIVLLIGRQYGTILKSIQNFLQQSENKQSITNLLQTKIGKNDKHKYFQHYLLLQKQFKF